MNISDQTVKKLLLNSGWNSGREVNTGMFKEMALKEGYMWFLAVDKFLGEFGDLRIDFTRKDGKNDFFHFDAVKAMADIAPEWIKEDYSPRLNNVDLCPIGQAFTSHMTLMIDEQGLIYGGYDEVLCLIGINPEEALVSICHNKELREIV